MFRSNPHRVPTPDTRFSRAILRSGLKGGKPSPRKRPLPPNEREKNPKTRVGHIENKLEQVKYHPFRRFEVSSTSARQTCRRPQRVSHLRPVNGPRAFVKKKKLSRLYFFTVLRRTVNKNLTSSIDAIILTRQLRFSRILMYNLFSASTYRRDTFKSYRDPCAVK